MSGVPGSGTLRVFKQGLVLRDGSAELEGRPFSGIAIELGESLGLTAVLYRNGVVDRNARDELGELGQGQLIMGPDDVCDYDDQLRVLYLDDPFTGWLVSPIRDEPNFVGLIDRYSEGSPTGHSMGWHADGAAAEVSQRMHFRDDEVELNSSFKWSPDGSLRSSSVRADKHETGQSGTTEVILNAEGDLSTVSWHTPSELLSFLPEVREVVADRIFVEPKDLAGSVVASKLRLFAGSADAELVEVLAADNGFGSLAELSTNITVEALGRLLAAATNLQFVDDHSRDVQVGRLLTEWADSAPSRRYESR